MSAGADPTPVLIVVVPLAAALLVPLAGLRSAALGLAVAAVGLVGAAAASVTTLARVLAHGTVHYHLGGWAPPWGIEFVLDPLSAAMATLVSGMALVCGVYALPHLRPWARGRRALFTTLYVLLTASLLGISVTGDLFNLYVFLEISALSTYCLLAAEGGRATVAAFRYLLVGTIAATFYLLGVGYLYALTGSLNMADVSGLMPEMLSRSPADLAVAVAFLGVGLGIKTALFPMHGWLPDAYAYAPAPAAGFITSVVGKVSAYAFLRVFYFVLRATGPAGEGLWLLGWVSMVAVLAGSAMALAQHDLRRMLAYSTVGQMGYIALGFAIGNPEALTGALFHVLHHAIVKGALFLIAGAITWKAGLFRIEELTGLGKRMPVTAAAFAVVAISMIGLPPGAGFFSKYYLIVGAVKAGSWPFAIAFVLSGLLSAIYFFRILERMYLMPVAIKGEPPPPAPPRSRPELPLAMLLPIVLLAVATVVLGVFHQSVVDTVITHALPPLSAAAGAAGL